MEVLVADDDRATRFLLEEMLGDWDYKTRVVSDGIAAREALLGTDPPEIALLDWVMPEVDGVSLCQEVKARKDVPYVYIILITGKTDTEDIVTALDAGADDFLSKPVAAAELRSRLAVGGRTVSYERTLRQYATRLQTLVNEREVFYQAFQHSVQGICITDTNGYIQHVNPAFSEAYGFRQEEMLGCNPRVLNPGTEVYEDHGIPADECQAMFRDLWESVAAPQTGEWDGVLLNQTKTGDLRWVHLFVNAILNSNKEPVSFVGMPIDITERVRKELAIRLECYRAISDLAEARDNETGVHLKRVSVYSQLLARALGMPRKYIEDIGMFSPLHDIGKVGIPDNILLAPRKLTDDEFVLMKTHAAIGYRILRGRQTLEMAAEIAHNHHEKWDGTGYPRGLQGEDIPLAGRIVALVDVYDALRTRRPYKEPWTYEETHELITSQAGRHFDPKVVEAYRSVEDEFDQTATRYADQIDELLVERG